MCVSGRPQNINFEIYNELCVCFGQTNTELRVLNISCSDVTLDAPCVEALEHMLLSNHTLASFPIELVWSAPSRLRHKLLDALKVNIGLRSSLSPLLLPWAARVAMRRFQGPLLGLDTPVDPICPDPADAAASDLVLDAGRLSAFDTWVEVGRGSFGVAYRTMLDGRPVCVKTIARAAAADDDEDDRGPGFFREVALMHELESESQAGRRCVYARHVVLPPGSTDTIWLVFDLMENGSLNHALARLTPSQRWQVLADVSRAVADLHEVDVLHRDLAVRNVLLDSLYRAYVCDFGLSCRGAYAWESPVRPTYDWAPETFSSEEATYTTEADVWSFGILMRATLLGRNPLHALTRDAAKSMYRVWAAAASQPIPDLEAVAQHVVPGPVSEGLGNRTNYQSAADDLGGFGNNVAQDDPAQWWDAHMALPGATPRDRALHLLAHACCRWQPVERPRMALVADLLAHVAAAAPSTKEFVLVHSAGEVLLLAQWWLLGERVAHTWRVQGNVRFVATPAQAVALAALVPRLRAELAAAEAAGSVDAAAVGSCLSRLAVLLDAQGATAEAAPLHARALALAEAAW